MCDDPGPGTGHVATLDDYTLGIGIACLPTCAEILIIILIFTHLEKRETGKRLERDG